MSRVFSTCFDAVSISAVQDVFSIKAGAANGVELHSVRLSAGGVAAPSEIRLRIKRLPATVTQGSGGTVATTGPTDSGDTKASASTVHMNDTVQATTSGTAFIAEAHQWNVLMPFEHLPPPEDRHTCQAGEAIVVDFPAAPASTSVSGTIQWRELP